MLNTIKKEDFSALSPASLTININDQKLFFSVCESRDLPPISPRQSPFAIILEGAATPLLPQGMYSLMHPTLGQLDLFIVPISRNATHARYEIIFN